MADAHAVLSGALSTLPEGAIPTAAIVVVQYEIPDAEPDGVGPWLAVRRDTEHPNWLHLGMLGSVMDDWRRWSATLGSSEE